ncbi:DUF4158 domain-containing protein [Streptomyces sp. NPDC059278]|uniref:DUF4158 domain-containing protein n=1 Tax=Streptomyces sp. NPDC059278 TaxID=3346801 RepID=UPI00368925C1
MRVFFTPEPEEAAWVRERTRSDEHLLALALALKCYQKPGYFPKADEVPEAVVEHVRGGLELAEGTGPHYESANTAKLHRKLVRERQGISYDQERARQIAEEAIRSAALVKNNPPDLINVALEEPVRATCELPAFRTLDEMAARIRREVDEDIFHAVRSRMAPEDQARLMGLLDVGGLDRESGLNRLKKPAKRPSWSHLKEQHRHLQWVDSLGTPARGWRASPRGRSPTSPPRRPRRTRRSCGTMRRASAPRFWPAWRTRPGGGPGTTWRRCSAVGCPPS